MAEDKEDIGRSVRIGLALTGSADSIRQLVEFTTSIVLARLLLPADFGIIAVVSSFMQISYVVGNFGMAGAVVQAKDVSRADCHTATAVSAASALLLTIGGAALAPWASGFFSMPMLERIMPIMACQITIAAFSSIPLAMLRRELRFGRVAIAESGGAAVYALVGIGLALSGYGVWSLVWAPISSAIWVLVVSIIASGYAPLPIIDRESLMRLGKFGGGLTLKNVFVYIGRNVDNFVVARLLGDVATGIYNRAFNLTRMPQTRLVGILYRVCFPAFCRLRDDEPRFHDWYVRATTAVAVGVTPLLLGLAAVAPDFTIFLLGENWAGMIDPLRILCVSALISCLHTLGGAAIEATGKVRYEVYTQSIYSLLVVTGCIIGARYGINGVAAGVLCASITLYAMKAFTVRTATGLPIRRYIGASAPSVAAGIIMWAATAWAASMMTGPSAAGTLFDERWVRLAACVGVGAVVYPLALAVVGRRHMQMVIEQIRLLFSRRGDRAGVATAS